MTGTLFIIATPIGNLHDITLRAVETIERVAFIACEDTRRATILLNFIERDLKRPFTPHPRPHLIKYHEDQEWKTIPRILTILKNGENVGLVSDAGTPTISDPGFKLVRECILDGIKIESIPGASSAIVALTVSGLPTDKFFFVGFLPHKEGNRMKVLYGIKTSQESLKSTVIIYEAPHRLVRALGELMTIFGDVKIVIARELTKVHEEIRREKISESIKYFQKTRPRGEFVLLFNLFTRVSHL